MLILGRESPTGF